MAAMRTPGNSRQDVVHCEILVDGGSLDPSSQVLSLSVSKESNRIPVAKIIFLDEGAPEKDFLLSNNDSFVPGKMITIKVGWDGDTVQVFRGIIIRHALKIKAKGSELHIECRDEAIRMSIGRHSKYYRQLTDAALFDQLITKYGLRADAEATGFVHEEIVQHHISDWDFLLLRAEANGMLVNVNDGAITISKPKTKARPVLQVTSGESIIEFEAELDALNQWKRVKTASWDYSTQQLLNAGSSSTDLSEPGNISGHKLADVVKVDYEMHHCGHLAKEELQTWADGALMRSRLSKIRGTAKVVGSSGIKPGDMITLEGVGDRFNGNAYVTAIRHDLMEGRWETHIRFGLNHEYHAQLDKDIADAPVAGLAGPINGLHVGKVMQLQSDPEGEDRILVKVPTIDNDAEGIWTRVATLDAGANRGSFFLPEIDDEVIVGFINDDPRHPVMLGMLHSSAKPAPIVAQETNDKKGFITRSRMHIGFDDGTKTITIDTPAGNSITLDESTAKIEIRDQGNNKVTMDAAGIKLESPGNIEIKAGVNCTISAASSLSIRAASISVKADGDIGIEGAMAKLSSQAITEITGSLVTIN